MAHGSNNFLTIPPQEGLFRTVRVDRPDEQNNSPPYRDEDEDDTEDDVRLIPRCSPVPRKRGASIADETAEYMRTRFAVPNRRVSFADSAGEELIDVRLFVPFDSDEDDDPGWEAEYREPAYRVSPEFRAPTGEQLARTVRANKLEVESVTPDPDEPLSFVVLVRVLNVSFHKSVHVRSTMDGWITHFDYPAGYVRGSHDGESDKFSVKLSFAPPYLFNGARIDFVVRYETPDQEFWANNSGKNYSVTLSQTYEEVQAQDINEENIELRGILKPPVYRSNIDYDEFYDKEDDSRSNEFEEEDDKTSFAQPTIAQPEIDIDTAKKCSSSPESARSFSTVGCFLSTTDSLYGEPLPLESTSPSFNSPQAETTDQLSDLHKSQTRSTSQVNFFNVFSPLHVPTVFVHLYDENHEDFNKPDHSLHPRQDDFHPEVAAQVPFEFDQNSSGGFLEASHIQEGLKERMQSKIIVVEEQSQHLKEENLHMLKVKSDQTTEDSCLTITIHSLTEALKHPLETGTQEKKVPLVSETFKRVEMMLKVESTRNDAEEKDGAVAYCLEQEGETQSSSISPAEETSDHEMTITPEGLKPDEDANVNKLVSSSDNETTSHETSKQTSISEASVPDFAFYPQPSTVHCSTEEDLACQDDKQSVAAFQMCIDSETKLPLPRESSETTAIPRDETEGILERCVTVSFTFFSATVCLAVGIQEPSAFLVVGLLLLSLCF